MKRKDPQSSPDRRAWRLEGRRVYFSREVERRLFFILTVILLLVGILYKVGIFS